MTKIYFEQLYNSFRKTGGFFISMFFALISFIALKYENTIKVNFLTIIIFSILILTTITLFDASLQFLKKSLNTSPNILKVIQKNNYTILLTEFSEYFQIQGLVSIFWLNDNFEEFIGYGEIINIQNDKKMQIQVTQLNTKINLEDHRKTLLIKPFITKKLINR